MSIYLFAHATTSAGNIVNFSDSKADCSDKHVKLSIICFKASLPYMWLGMFVSICVFLLTHTPCADLQTSSLAQCPDRWVGAGELREDSQYPQYYSSSFIHVCVCTCVCVFVKHKVERDSRSRRLWHGMNISTSAPAQSQVHLQ